MSVTSEGKMWLKLAVVLPLYLTTSASLEGNRRFSVVSATQHPPQHQLNDHLIKIEKKLNENSQRLQVLEQLEFQNKQIQNKLNSIDFSLAQEHSGKTLPRDCQEVKERGGTVSDIYLIRPNFNSKAFFVFCNMEIRGGGWTYFLNRFDGSQNFYLNWTDYKNGFGNLAKEFWLGLEHLHQLTGNELNELLVELVDWNQVKAYAHYSAFSIGDETEGYSLKVLGKCSGDAGDSLNYHFGMKFSTKDKDQDNHSIDNCAAKFNAAWWFNSCFRSLLTGRYRLKNEVANYNGTIWLEFRSENSSLKEARMMIRPRNLKSK